MVPPADGQERAGAPLVLLPLAGTVPRLDRLWAARADGGPRQTGGWQTFGGRLQRVGRPGGRGRWRWRRADQEPPARRPGFPPLPHRWIVERTMAWSGRNRRRRRADAFRRATSAAWGDRSMVRLLLKRLAHAQVPPPFPYRRVA